LRDGGAPRALSIDEALPIARQIAEALEAAHEQGIVHRDLKPANIKVRPDGTVKVLDFGLAKAMEPAASPAPDLTASPTITAPAMTQAGIILGTAAYMSPEQARGRPVDKRTDIWAFGCVLYEMLTGRQAFAGEDVGLTLAEIMKSEPDWSSLPPDLPRPVPRLLRRCLDKDPHSRLRDIGEARIELREPLESGPMAPEALPEAPSSRPRTGSAPVLVGAVVGALVAGGLIGRLTAPSGNVEEPARFSLRLPRAPLALGSGVPLGFDLPIFDISRDGRRLVYVGERGSSTQLFLINVGEFGATPVEGTEGAYSPFFSPDGEWLGFFSGDQLRRIPIAGGRPESLAPVSGVWGAAWVDDIIYFTTDVSTVIKRVPATGGVPEEVANSADLDGVAQFWALAPLPARRGLLVATSAGMPMSADYRDIRAFLPETGQWQLVLPNAGFHPRYAESGHLVFARAGGLRAAAIDLASLAVTGEPVPIVEGVRLDSQFGYAQFALSDTGTLAYVQGGDVGIGVPTWANRDGTSEPLPLPPQAYGMFTLSPDGTRLAVHVGGPTDQVWVYDVATGRGTRLTTEGNNGWPLWVRDGRQILYVSKRGDEWTLELRPSDGTGAPEVMYSGNERIIASAWSGRDDVAVFSEGNDEAGIGFLSLGTGDIARPPRLTGSVEWGHRFSPDGRWLAYSSRRDGPYEIFVRPYPDLFPETRVSVNGGTEPIWSRAGELVYHNGNRWMASRVSTDGGFSSSPPIELFQTAFVDSLAVSWDLGSDDRILIVKPSGPESDPGEIRVVQHWFTELGRLVPVD
jgi:serine/threonine-protein kinase